MVDKGAIDHIKWFSEINHGDIEIAGGKGASLGEMYNSKFPIPPGFVVTAQAYRVFIDENNIDKIIQDKLSDLDVEKTEELNKASKEIRESIENTEFSSEMKEEVLEAYEVLGESKINRGASEDAMAILHSSKEPCFVAVRSSATAEDLEDASFAGQQESFLNIKGDREVLKKVRKCFSSLFTPRAIYYRTKKGFDHNKVNLSVVVQKMVDSDKSGVMFSKNPVSDKDEVLIEAVFGLGEGLVSGRINPDSYTVKISEGEFEIKKEIIGNKKVAITRNSSGENEIVKLNQDKARSKVLDNYQIKILAQYGKMLEKHYKKPQDIEFALEGKEIYIVQSRPITTKSTGRDGPELSGKILLKGLGASPGVSSGKVKIVHDLNELNKIEKGDVLVTEMTNPDMVVSMQKASGIITDEGGLTSHAAIVSREMGIPAIVGTGDATKKLKDGDIVSVDGNNGNVLEGRVERKEVEILSIVPTKTKIKVIVDLPEYAIRAAKSESKAVGLVRLEGIIAVSGKHPNYYVKQGNMEEYISVLSAGLKKIAEPFEEIWIRSSDLRSDEYSNLEGAPKNKEGNPMLGDHGIRFSLKNPEILKSELQAVKDVADDFPNKKIGLMAPQIIAVDELKKMKEIAENVGMPKNVKLGIMVETPAAVQIINKLCEEGIDFISFGTNDLTQYTLAIDRNNPDVQDIYDALNPAVLSSLSYVIRRCKKHGVETSICGQAGSDPEMAKFLVREGIDSISVNADAAKEVSEVVAKVENDFENFKDNIAEKVIPEGEVLGDKLNNQQNIEKSLNTIPQKIPKPIPNGEDMEEIILRELEEDYNPGSGDNSHREEIPSLNESIPIDSSSLQDEEEEIIEVNQNTDVNTGKVEERKKENDRKNEVPEPTEEEYGTKEEILDIF